MPSCTVPRCKREAHVRAAVVDGVHPAIVEEERQRMPGNPDGGAPSGAYVVQPSGSHEAIRDGIQRRNPFLVYTSLYDTYGAESRSLTAARPPVRAAASSAAMVGAQVHTPHDANRDASRSRYPHYARDSKREEKKGH